MSFSAQVNLSWVSYREKGIEIGRQEGILIGHQKGREEGIAEDEKQAKIAVAREMLVDKMDINTIAKFTGLSISEIEKLQEAITLE